MQLIKYLFEGFFIALMGTYFIGKPIKPNDIVIMASAIAITLMLSDQVIPFLTYLKKKTFSTVYQINSQFGGSTLHTALNLQEAVRLQTGGMDGTMSLQTAQRMQAMLAKKKIKAEKVQNGAGQSGGMDGTMSLQTAQRMQAMLKKTQNDGLKLKNISGYTPTQSNSDENDCCGTYANYDTVYNMPDYQMDVEPLAKLEEGLNHPKYNINIVEREIKKRLHQSGGATPVAKNLLNLDLVKIADNKNNSLLLNSAGAVIFANDKTSGSPLYKLRFEAVDEAKPTLMAIKYVQPVHLVYNDAVTGEKKIISYDEGGKLTTEEGNAQNKFILVDATKGSNQGYVDLSKNVLIKTLTGNKFLDVKNGAVAEGDTKGTPFTVSVLPGCGPLWVHSEAAKQKYASSVI